MGESIKPGIYVNEIDKSQFITEGPSTLTGVAGEAKKGPANEITFISSYKQYVEVFGQDSGYLDFFARFFFKYGGNKLYVVRVTDDYRFAGLSLPINSVYELDGALVSSDLNITLGATAISGADIANWPDSGIVRIDYRGEEEYVQYTRIAGQVLTRCKRAINGTTALSIPVWGTDVTPDRATDYFTSVTPHGLRVGDRVRFLNTEGGVTVGTDYYVVTRHPSTPTLAFQISTTLGGTFMSLNDMVGSIENTVQKQPVPTKYVTLIASAVRATVDSVNSRDVTYSGLKYGILPSTGYVSYYTATGTMMRLVPYTTPTTPALTITLGGSHVVPAAGADGYFTLYVANYYGGLGDQSFSKYQEYDAWDQPSYDEEGNLTDAGSVTDPEEDELFMNIYARTCGKWANDEIKVSVYTKDGWNVSPRPYYFGKIQTVPTTDDELLFIVEDATTGLIAESFLVSLLLTKVDYWNKTMYINDVINEKSKYIRVFVNSAYINQSAILPASIEKFYLDGGTDGDENTPIREYKIMGGYDLFANKNEVNIDILSAGGNQSLAIQQNIVAICDARKDCIGVLNIPEAYNTSDALAYKALLTASSYAAVFYNGFEYLDAFTGTKLILPPAIQVTPIMVQSDLTREPWSAAAGYTRGLLKEVLRLEHKVNDGDFELLYMEGINPIVNDGDGPVLLGIKTMTTVSSAFSKITTRRLMIKIEKDVKNSMKGFMFEPNTFDTRLRVVRTVEPYLDSIRSRDGIEDFKVISDTNNNTNQTIAEGKLIVDVWVKPIFAAEFIIFNFTVTKDDISSVINQ
jgi:phage tail sheath protein FI